MSMLERLSDVRGTLEGKIVAVVLTLLLVMPVISVTAFAVDPEEGQPEKQEQTQEQSLAVTGGQDGTQELPTAITEEPAGSEEEPMPMALPEPESVKVEVRFNWTLDNGNNFYSLDVDFIPGGGDQSFGIPEGVNEQALAQTPEGEYFNGWSTDKKNPNAALFTGSTFTIPGNFDPSWGAYELYTIYSDKPSETPDPDPNPNPNPDPKNPDPVLQEMGVKADGYTGQYDAEEHSISVEPSVQGATIFYRLSENGAWSTDKPVFKDVKDSTTVYYRVECDGYKPAEGKVDVTITPCPLTLVTESLEKVYDGAPLKAADAHYALTVTEYNFDPQKSFDLNESCVWLAGDFEEQTATVTLKDEMIDVARDADSKVVGQSIKDYEITWGQNVNPDNYVISDERLGTLTITPAPLTVATKSATKVYDGTPLTAEGTIEGFVNGEQAEFKTTGSQTDVNESGTENTYEIIWNGSAKAGNYEVVKETLGLLKVTPGSFSVTAEGYVGTYDGESHGITIIDAPEGATITYSVNGNPSTNKFVDAGTVEVSYTVTHPNPNYEPVTGTVTVVINPAAVTIRVNDASKTVGSPDPEITGTIEGEVPGHPLQDVVYQRRTDAQAVGTYIDDLTVVFTPNSNYDVTVEDGDFTINPLPAPGTVPNDGGPIDNIVTFLTTPIFGGATTAGTTGTTGTGTLAAASIEGNPTPMASIEDDSNPMGAFDHPLCWIHYYILLGMIITAIYGGGVIARRLNHAHKVHSYEDNATGKNRTKQPAGSSVTSTKTQPVMVKEVDA